MSESGESRRGFLRNTALLIGGLLVGSKGVEVVSAKPTLVIEAEEKLKNPKLEKSDYQVKDAQEIREKGGAAVRDYPKATLPNEKSNLIKTLQPGERITGGIEVYGKSAINSTTQEPVLEWIAFRNGDNNVAFIHKDNVQIIPKQ